MVVLFAARLALNTAHRIVYPFLPVIARGLGIPLEQAGVLASVRWITGLATPAVVGTIGRGERRRRLITLGLALFTLGTVVTALTDAFVGALLGFAVLGLAKPTFDVAAQAYVADRTPYELRARYLSIIELTWAGGLLLGAPFAGWLIARFDWHAPFAALAVVGAAVLVAARLVLDEDHPVDAAARHPLRLDGAAVALLVVTGLFSLAAELVFVVIGAWLEDRYSLALVAIGLGVAIVAVSEAIGEGATIVVTDRVGKRRAVAIGLLISIAAFGGLVVDPDSLPVGLALMAVAFAGFEFTIVSAIPLASEVRPRGRARFLSLLVVAMALGRALGDLVGPALFTRWGIGAAAAAAALVDVGALILLLVRVEADRPATR